MSVPTNNLEHDCLKPSCPGEAKCATNTHKVAHGPGNTKALRG